MVAPGPTPSSRLSRPARRKGLPLWADIPSFTAFAQEIESVLDGPELPYSQRQHLLQRAAHFGISRFDANLIIAMVQNRISDTESIPDAPHGRPFPTFTLLAAGITQLAILLAVWWLMR